MLLCIGALGCSGPGGDPERVPPDVQAQLPLNTGGLYALCPVPDLPRARYAAQAAVARRQTRALIHEVRRRPDAVVTRTWEDSHSGERHREELSVRALAEEHLEEPGVEGVPCARRLMTRLRAAVDPDGGHPPAAADDPVFLIDEVARGLGLVKRGATYRNAHCREVQEILTTREEVQQSLDEPIANVEVVAAPRRHVAVSLFRPTPACRSSMRRGLAAIEARKAP